MDVLIEFAIIFILILLNGMFVAAEFAIIGVRPTRIAQLAEDGHVTARRVHNILSDPGQVDRYIASAQLGITLASLGLGMYGEPVIAHLIEPPLHDWFGLSGEIVHTISFFIALGLITYLHVVIGEMIPKSLALQSAERVVFALSAPMFLMQTVFSYPITALNGIGLQVLRLLDVPPPEAGAHLHTPGELAMIISDSVVGGEIESEEHRLLRNIFEFAEVHVGEIMTPRPKIDAVPLDISKEDLLERMFTSPHNRFPVYDGDPDHIVGILHLKDLVHHHLEDAPFDLSALVHEVPHVPEGTHADELLTRLKQRQVHMAIVIDEFGGTAGIVTLEDLLEEVVGDVRDEFDTEEEPDITLVEPGHIVALGTARLHDITEHVKLDLDEPDDNIDTIGGLLISRIDLPPTPGSELVIDSLTLRVEAVDGLTIERVSLHFEPHTDDESHDDHN